jgi:hypothetical protein
MRSIALSSLSSALQRWVLAHGFFYVARVTQWLI